MKIATVQKNSLSKKQLTYIMIGVAAILTIVGMTLGFFTLQRVTRASEEEPQNVSISPSESKATVTWQTSTQTSAIIEYGTAPDPSSFTGTAIADDSSTEHSVDVSTLEPNTTYYFQIRVGDTVYDNGGQLWSFTTAAGNGDSTPTEAPPEAEASPSVTVETPTLPPAPTPSETPEENGNQSNQTASDEANVTPGDENPTTPTAIPTNTTGGTCSFTSCTAIRNNLGTNCTTQDYIKCLFNISPTAAVSTTPSPSPVSSTTKSSCKIDYFQSNSCTSFTWTDIKTKSPTCASTYTKYFVQCKSNSFGSNDAATWYCNETQTGNTLTVPCGTAPTPAPGQSVFCRIRAETETTGSTDATPWVYANTSCSSLSTSDTACDITYLQGNTCRSWIWDSVNNTNPACAKAFDHYFLQCNSAGDFTGATGTWYCNTTSDNHYVDMPCYNAPTPADGASLTCRVRAEDAYGGDGHATSWVSTSSTCPTSTPTPTYSPTPTPTNTPTPTPTP